MRRAAPSDRPAASHGYAASCGPGGRETIQNALIAREVGRVGLNDRVQRRRLAGDVLNRPAELRGLVAVDALRYTTHDRENQRQRDDHDHPGRAPRNRDLGRSPEPPCPEQRQLLGLVRATSPGNRAQPRIRQTRHHFAIQPYPPFGGANEVLCISGIAAFVAHRHEGLGDRGDLAPHREAQPEVLVFVHRQCFVESTDLLDQAALGHHGRCADDGVQRQQSLDDVAIVCDARFVSGIGHRPPFGIDDRQRRVAPPARRRRLHRAHLHRELGRRPHVIGIHECDVPTPRDANGRVPCDRRPARMQKPQHPDARIAEAPQVRPRLLSGAIVGDDELPVSVRLPQHRVDGRGQELQAIERRQDDGDEWRGHR